MTGEFPEVVCLLSVTIVPAPVAGGTLPRRATNGAVSMAGRVATLLLAWTLPTDLVVN